MRPRKKQTAISILRIPCGMQRANQLEMTSNLHVSILRIPCWMQRGKSVWISNHRMFQSYASLAGCNVTNCAGKVAHLMRFNLTHPLRDATCCDKPTFSAMLVSILRIPCGMQQQYCTLHGLFFYVSLYIFTDMVYLTLWLRIYCIGFTLNHFYLLVRSFK